MKSDWLAIGQKELKDSLHEKINENIAKNVIFFLGDGMGISTITAGRIYKGEQKGVDPEGYMLSFDKFPHLALVKVTYFLFHYDDNCLLIYLVLFVHVPPPQEK